MKTIVLIGTLISTIFFLSLQSSWLNVLTQHITDSQKWSSGAPSGFTGAPGENACVACHSGAVQDGTVQNIFSVSQGGVPVSAYIPGEIYSVRLELNSGNVLEGFQATVLDVSGNNMAGDFTASNSGTTITSGLGRQYANHNVQSNFEGNPGWEWQWEAPSTDLGPVRFYIASNKSNGDSQPDIGDIIYTSQHTLGSPLGLKEINEITSGFQAAYNSSENLLHLRFSAMVVDRMYLNLVDLNGRSVYTKTIGDSEIGENKSAIRLPENLGEGLYVVHFFVGNKSMSAKVRIGRE